MPPPDGVALRAAFEATCLRGALPPVDLRAVCLVRAIVYNFLLLRLCAHKLKSRSFGFASEWM
jgi:hypothetical protein